MFRRVQTAWRTLLHRDRSEGEMDEEMRFHLAMETKKLVERGWEPERARTEAMRAFGGVEKFKEECRDATGAPLIEASIRDLRYALRMMRKSPGFAAVTVLTLALGIGANTAIFSVVHAVFLRDLPYGGGDRLVRLHLEAPGAGITDARFSAKEVGDIAAMNRAFSGVAEYHSMWFILLGNQEPQRVQTGVVSANFFDVLGVRPLLGRTFRPGEDAHGADPVLVLSYDYWRRTGGNPKIVGRTFKMNDHIHTVIGVLPPLPAYPDENDVYMPTSACPFRDSPAMRENRDARMVLLFGRMKPGATLAAANSDLASVLGRLERAYPASYPTHGTGLAIGATSLRKELTRDAGPTFLILLVTVGLILLLACANVANLTLARLFSRQRELALRSALGAARSRLMRQLLTESTLFSLMGGLAGLLMAFGTFHMLTAFAARFTPRAAEIRIDGQVLLFTLAVSVASGVLFGLLPALSLRRVSLKALQEEGERSTGGIGRQRARAVLVVVQVAASFVLLIGAGLMVRSLWKLEAVDTGFDVRGVLTARLDLNFTRYKDGPKRLEFEGSLLDRLSAAPGISAAAMAGTLPLNENGVSGQDRFDLEGHVDPQNALGPRADFEQVSEGYFRVLHIPVLAGRAFTPADDQDAPKVSVIDVSLANRYFGASGPLGRRITVDGGKSWITVVGVVNDVTQYSLADKTAGQAYLPLRQYPALSGTLFVRTSGNPMDASRLIRGAVRSLDSEQPVDRFQPLQQVRANALASPRLTAMLLALFAVLALTITSAGIAAVVAFSVGARRQEFGVRMALGATSGEIVRMVLRQAMTLVVLGLSLGFLGAHLLAGLMTRLLFEVRATDPPTFLAMSLLLAAIAAVACFIPAARITGVEPNLALRTA